MKSTALFLAVLAASASAAVDAEILINPGFEDAQTNSAPWVASGTAAHIGAHAWRHYEGRQSGGIGNDDGPANAHGAISQELNVPGEIRRGDLFLLSAWLETEDRFSGKALVAIEFLDADGAVLGSAQSAFLSGRVEWTNLTVTGEAPAGARRVVVKCLATNLAPGKGMSFVWFDNLRVDAPVFAASSTARPGASPHHVMRSGAWRSQPADDQWLTIDSRAILPLTGLAIGWSNDYATEYEVLTSADGEAWATVYTAGKKTPGPDTIYLGSARARFIKIACRKSAAGRGFGIESVRLMGAADTVTLKRYFEILAAEHPARFPRWMTREQAYWTGVGVPDDFNEAILCEDGTIEPHPRGFSIAPFLHVDGRLITRDDADVAQALERRYLPLPSVTWTYRGIELDVRLLADGKAGESVAYAWYRIMNRRDADVAGRLFLALRPFQVYPPWQGGGGWSAITNVTFSNNVLTIDERYRVLPLTVPAAAGSIAGSEHLKFPFKTPGPPELEGDITSFMSRGELPGRADVRDTNGLASSGMAWDFSLAPGASEDIFLALPLHEALPALHAGMKQAALRAVYERMLAKSARYWEKQVSRIGLEIPDRGIVDTLKANIAFSLITRDGPAFQPGSRSYDKAWMRDGGMSAAALLRMGLTIEIREFIDWFAGFQFESGEVPPIIDHKVEDPLWEEKEKGLIEYDSQGEFVYTILQDHLFTRDRAFLEGKLTNVVKALQFLVELRSRTMTAEFRDGPPEKRKYYGILPPSTSHEGYGREYSYWDDFWALRGWKDGRRIFEILGRDDLAAWAEKEYGNLRDSFYESMRLTMETAKIRFIPGSASLSDFDATSTAVALMYCDELDNLPKDALKYTFDRYYKELLGRADPAVVWRIVPYELRSIPAFLFMGEKDRALYLLRFMLDCRRPPAWLQLAEVAHSDYRFPTYIGDMPHTWVGAEYLFAVRTLFVYETRESLVLGAGIDPAWLVEGKPIRVTGFPTEFGRISYDMTRRGNTVRVRVRGRAAPADGFLLKSPLDQKPAGASLNGRPLDAVPSEGVRFDKLPAEIVLQY